MLREWEEALRDLLAAYNPLAALSRKGEPDGDGFVPPGWMLPLPRDLMLPLINLEELEPAPEEVERVREALAVPVAPAWWEAALELGVVSAAGKVDLELKDRLRQCA